MKQETKTETVKRVGKRVALGIWYVVAIGFVVIGAAIWVAVVIGGWPGGYR